MLSRLRLSLFAAAALVSGCDSGGNAVTHYLRFSPDAPRAIVAGDSLQVTAVGESSRPYESADVLVFRGEPDFGSGGLVGDTLFAQRLDVTPGTLSFSETVTVRVPVDAITRSELGTIWVSTPGAAAGQEIQLIPAAQGE
ncbi:MAG TPA: hypothetical protein VF594_08735 [Rubricoccaceae bacterium]|jgi:hypothetical protein